MPLYRCVEWIPTLLKEGLVLVCVHDNLTHQRLKVSIAMIVRKKEETVTGDLSPAYLLPESLKQQSPPFGMTASKRIGAPTRGVGIGSDGRCEPVPRKQIGRTADIRASFNEVVDTVDPEELDFRCLLVGFYHVGTLRLSAHVGQCNHATEPFLEPLTEEFMEEIEVLGPSTRMLTCFIGFQFLPRCACGIHPRCKVWPQPRRPDVWQYG